jgi:hypothetical protein
MSTSDWLNLSLVVITAFYAWATFRMLRANERVVHTMQEQTDAQLRPYVAVSASTRIGTTLLLLEVQNTGKSPATHVRLKMDKDFFFNGEKGRDNVANFPAFSQVIDSIAPGARLQFVLGVGHTIFAVDDSVCPKLFSVQADYRFGAKAYSEANIVDLRPLMNSSAIQDPVADEIRKLRESLEKVLKR